MKIRLTLSSLILAMVLGVTGCSESEPNPEKMEDKIDYAITLDNVQKDVIENPRKTNFEEMKSKIMEYKEVLKDYNPSISDDNMSIKVEMVKSHLGDEITSYVELKFIEDNQYILSSDDRGYALTLNASLLESNSDNYLDENILKPLYLVLSNESSYKGSLEQFTKDVNNKEYSYKEFQLDANRESFLYLNITYDKLTTFEAVKHYIITKDKSEGLKNYTYDEISTLKENLNKELASYSEDFVKEYFLSKEDYNAKYSEDERYSEMYGEREGKSYEDYMNIAGFEIEESYNNRLRIYYINDDGSTNAKGDLYFDTNIETHIGDDYFSNDYLGNNFGYVINLENTQVDELEGGMENEEIYTKKGTLKFYELTNKFNEGFVEVLNKYIPINIDLNKLVDLNELYGVECTSGKNTSIIIEFTIDGYKSKE